MNLSIIYNVYSNNVNIIQFTEVVGVAVEKIPIVE